MFTKRFLDKNGKNLFQRGKQTFIDNPKKAFGLDDADSIGSKMLRNFKNKIFGFKEVNTKQLYEVTSDMYTKIGDEGIEKLARYEKAGLRTKLRAGTVDEIIEHKGLVGKIIDFIKKVGDNLANILFKHKFTRKIMEECKLTKTAIKTVFNKIAKKIGVEAVEASGEMVAKKGFKKLMGNIGTWAGSVTGGLSLLIPAGIIIWDTIQGYNKAPLWLNSPKPTMLQKFSCALTAGFISFVGNSGNPSIYVQVLTTFLEMSDSIMGMISGLIYGALNAIVGETPNTGKKDYTEGEKARYSVVDMGNGKSVVVEGKDAAKKWTNQTAGEIALGVGGEALSSTIQAIAPGVNNLSEALVFVLAQLADVLSGGVIGAYNGFQYANMRNNAVNVNVGGQGSGRGNSLLKDSPSGGITSKTASGLMFISQKKFMNNRLLGGESLTANGCAISCMKMIANHIGLKVSDSSLIETARKYLDKTNNGVKLEYFTNYGGQVTENYESVKNNLLTSKGNSGAIFLIKKNNGLHYVVVLNNKGRLYFGDPEEEDFLEMSPSSNLFEKALNCVYFGPNNGLLSTYRLGDRKGVFTSLTGRGPFKSVGFTPGMSRIIKGKEKMNSARKFNKKDEKEDKNGLGEININLGGNSTSTGTTSGAVDSSLYKGALEPAIYKITSGVMYGEMGTENFLDPNRGAGRAEDDTFAGARPPYTRDKFTKDAYGIFGFNTSDGNSFWDYKDKVFPLFGLPTDKPKSYYIHNPEMRRLFKEAFQKDPKKFADAQINYHLRHYWKTGGLIPGDWTNSLKKKGFSDAMASNLGVQFIAADMAAQGGPNSNWGNFSAAKTASTPEEFLQKMNWDSIAIVTGKQIGRAHV